MTKTDYLRPLPSPNTRMSVTFSYADRISFREDLGGRLGDPELRDPETQLRDASLQLASFIKSANKIMFFSGAGLSTACGIPDFRGPNGIWTVRAREADKRKKSGKQVVKGKNKGGLKDGAASSETPSKKQKLENSAENNASLAASNVGPANGQAVVAEAVPLPFVRPSLTHQFISHLISSGVNGEHKEIHVTSQNVDGLHFRSGVPRSKLSELHGSVFVEFCPRCKAEYPRDFELETVGHRTTGRSCEKEGCRGRLRDTVLDWEQALPDEEVDKSIDFARTADLVICLGSSLRIVPAADIPFMMKYGPPAAKADKKGKNKVGAEEAGETIVEAPSDARPSAVDGVNSIVKPETTEQSAEPSLKIEEHASTALLEDVTGTISTPDQHSTNNEININNGKVVIINLQETPKDSLSDLRVFGECDRVFRIVAAKLGMQIPEFVRRDRWQFSCVWRAVQSKDKMSWDHYVDFALQSGGGGHLPVANVSGVACSLVLAPVENAEGEKPLEGSVTIHQEPFSGTAVIKRAMMAAMPKISLAVRLVQGAADAGRERFQISLDRDGASVEQGIDVEIKGTEMQTDPKTGDTSWRMIIEAITQVCSYH